MSPLFADLLHLSYFAHVVIVIVSCKTFNSEDISAHMLHKSVTRGKWNVIYVKICIACIHSVWSNIG